jgi:fatty acid desaturase
MKVSDYLSKEEQARFTRRSDLQGFRLLATNWLIIFAIFWVVAQWTNPLTLLLGVILLGGRQLGLAVLMHEAGHRSLFKSQALNNSLGQWLCAYPIMGDVNGYAASHRVHHQTAGTDKDPDLPNYRAYPISRASFKRKIIRDITGQTGLKLLVGLARGRGDIMTGGDSRRRALYSGLFVNLVLFLVLYVLGMAEFYLLWFVAYVTAYPLVARIRQVAEHGSVVDLYHLDPRLNTRTTRARWFERLIFCPNNVCYHIEHHFLASVPCYHLKALHENLVQKGFYAGHEAAVASGYWNVIQRAVPELAGAAHAA